jgi:hypothetical protein
MNEAAYPIGYVANHPRGCPMSMEFNAMTGTTCAGESRRHWTPLETLHPLTDDKRNDHKISWGITRRSLGKLLELHGFVFSVNAVSQAFLFV